MIGGLCCRLWFVVFFLFAGCKRTSSSSVPSPDTPVFRAPTIPELRAERLRRYPPPRLLTATECMDASEAELRRQFLEAPTGYYLHVRADGKLEWVKPASVPKSLSHKR